MIVFGLTARRIHTRNADFNGLQERAMLEIFASLDVCSANTFMQYMLKIFSKSFSDVSFFKSFPPDK